MRLVMIFYSVVVLGAFRTKPMNEGYAACYVGLSVTLREEVVVRPHFLLA
jgi:hypothetical protein